MIDGCWPPVNEVSWMGEQYGEAVPSDEEDVLVNELDDRLDKGDDEVV